MRVTFRAPKGPPGNVLPSVVVDSYTMHNTRDSRQRPDYTCAFFARPNVLYRSAIKRYAEQQVDNSKHAQKV